MLVLVLPLSVALAAPTITVDEVKLLGGYLTASLASDGRVDVVSAEEVRRALEFEAERASIGCSTSSCLAEIAGALGADVVVFGEAGALGDRVLLNVSLFDATKGHTAGRLVLEGATLADVTREVKAGARTLIDSYAAPDPASPVPVKRAKLVVLDLTARGASSAASSGNPRANSLAMPALIAGTSVIVIGAVLGGASLAVDVGARDVATPASELKGREGLRDLLGVAGVVAAGAGVVAAGAGTALLFFGGE